MTPSPLLTTNRQQGFTLIEMSVVLVIIGLLIAAIVAGKTLYRQTQIMSAAGDEQTYVKAVQTFQQKYTALPGDMANATSFWGSMTACAPTNGATSQFPLTCNGNGSGQIDNGVEEIYAWEHLADAGLISGSYSGIPGSGGSTDNVITKNVPAGRMKGSGFGIYYLGIQTSSSTTNFSGNYGHAIFLGDYTSNSVPTAPTMTAQEAQAFDSKYDDGNPTTGSVRIWLPSYLNSSCGTSSTSTATYNVSASGLTCALIFITGF